MRMLLPGTGKPLLWVNLYTLLSLIVRIHARCPRVCFCNDLSKIVYCSRRGLSYIPEGIPRDSLQLNLNSNVFKTNAIQRSNFSKLANLEHLYMSECGIEIIEVDTFVDLVNLKWLDLSFNRIKEIRDFTFRGLTMQHLFLNGNRNIQLHSQSFGDLVTTGLYLHDCSLTKLTVDILAPLNMTLRKLWLNGNALERLDKKFLPLFSSLLHLRLGSNPIHCNCETLWIKEFYDKNGEVFKGAVPPSCLTPIRLKGKFFNELTLFEFRCQPPVFNNIDAQLDDTRGKLRCTASGDPAPTLYWIQPTGEAKRYAPPLDEDARKNEGILNITTRHQYLHTKKNVSGMYICVANNEAGNVTLTINITWPQTLLYRDMAYKTLETTTLTPPSPSSSSVPSASSSLSSSSVPVAIPPPNKNNNNNNRNNKQTPGVVVQNNNNINNNNNPKERSTNYTSALNMLGRGRGRNGEKVFNLTELLGAVIGTHVCTLLLCLIFMPIYYKRKCRTRNNSSPSHTTTSLEKKKPPSETLYLNGHGHHPMDHYMDTPSPTKREEKRIYNYT